MNMLGKFTAFASLALLSASAVMAQGRKELRINEVMVQNETSVGDAYGNRSAWIELINPTEAAVDISSIYVTDDLKNPTKYYVPRGDKATKIGKGQTVLFRADGHDNHGTFYLNFELVPGRDNFIAIFDADGINLIDSVTVPASVPADFSYARIPDYKGEWAVRPDSLVTAGGLNVVKGPNNKIDNFSRLDSHGFAMAAMAMSVVFSALLVLSLCFTLIAAINTRKSKAKAEPKADLTPAPAAQTPAADDEAEVAAAIAMALHQHLTGGLGNARLTMVPNPASSWAVKTQAMRKLPRK